MRFIEINPNSQWLNTLLLTCVFGKCLLVATIQNPKHWGRSFGWVRDEKRQDSCPKVKISIWFDYKAKAITEKHGRIVVCWENKGIFQNINSISVYYSKVGYT